MRSLLDSNVIVAAVAEEHSHHPASFPLLLGATPATTAIAGHSYAEAFTTLTRRNGPAPHAWPPERAWAALESIAGVTSLVGLTPLQSREAIKAFAIAGGVGARVYDWLIGQAAVQAGISTIITWNVSHLRGLFPDLKVVDPAEAGVAR